MRKLNLIKFMKLLRRSSFVMLLPFLFVSNTLANEKSGFQFYSPDEAVRDRVFGGDQAGMFLWPSLNKFCPHLNAAREENGNDLNLLYSNETQTEFYTAHCVMGCSLSDEMRAMAECQGSLDGGICKLFAAVHGSRVYDLTVSADGQKLSEVCNGG